MGVHEDPIHKFAVEYIGRVYPKIVLHHSPNEGPAFANEGWRFKQYSMGMQAGWPDIEMVYQGWIGFLEIKRPGPKGKLSEAQFRCLESLNSAGAYCAVCNSPETVMASVDAFVVAVDVMIREAE